MLEYKNVHRSSAKANDGYSQVLREASEYFDAMQIKMLTAGGFSEILSEGALFNEYVNQLTQNLSATDATEVAQLMENTAFGLMSESTIAAIQPVAALSMPTIRKMWVRVALKNAVPTEPVKAPKFLISYTEPYIMGSDGVKHPIPQSLRNLDNELAEKKPLFKGDITLPTKVLDENNWTEKSGEKGSYNLLGKSGGSVAARDAIDTVFFIETVEMKDEVTHTNTSGDQITFPKVVKVHQAPDIRGNFHFEVKHVAPALKVGEFYNGIEVKQEFAGKTTTDVIFGNINYETGMFTATSLNDKVAKVTVKGSLSSENNTHSMSVSFDIRNKDVTIGTGAHLNAVLPVEWLQDTMAMYNIDGALEVVDLMSNTVAQKLDQEIYQFLKNSLEMHKLGYEAEFDVRPSGSFAGSPKEWREELKTVIDHLAIRIKNDSAFTAGKFVIIGNPLDVNLITNVNWTFNSSTEDRGGVNVEFNLGAYAGALRYELVSSMNVPAGKIYMIFIPDSPNYMTYKYYPYTFNVEKGYRDPNMSLVPAITMTKRHTIEEFLPLIAGITITGNNASMLNTLKKDLA